MRAHDHWFQSHLREMSREECLDLLGAEEVGHIGFIDDHGPVVLPVNYTVHEGCVLIATGLSTSIARFAVGHSVAFEVAEVDPFTESGWSVLVRGRAEIVRHDELHEAQDLPRPWAEGPRPLVVRIVATAVTGRWLIEA